MAKSADTLAAEAAAQRRSLQASVSELRQRLSPSNIGQEIGAAANDRVAFASAAVSEKAATPGGLIALCGMAFATAFAAAGGLSKKVDAVLSQSSARLPVAVTTEPVATASRGEVASMLFQLSAAMAAGVVASRFLPATEAERTILNGVAPELRQNMQRWAADNARRLVTPASDRYGLPNLVGLLAAVAVARRRR